MLSGGENNKKDFFAPRIAVNLIMHNHASKKLIHMTLEGEKDAHDYIGEVMRSVLSI